MEWGHDDDTERWISDDGNEAGAESARSNSAEDWLRKYRCSAMTSTASESHLADCCERLLDLVGEAAELLQAKANNYFDSDLARTATSLVDISYQLRREMCGDSFLAEDGWIRATDEPGLGIQINEEVFEKYYPKNM